MSSKRRFLPPHFPKTSHTLGFRRNRPQSLLWFGVVVVLTCVTALAVTLSAIAWLVPGATIQTPVYTFRSARPVFDEEKAFPPLVEKQVAQRLVSLYDTRTIVDGLLYPVDGFVGGGVVLSSGGWVATYMPEYVKGSEKDWDVVDYQGTVYKVVTAVYDKESQLLFIQIDGDGFRGDIAMVDSETLPYYSPLIGLGHNTSYPLVLDGMVQRDGKRVHDIFVTRYDHLLVGDAVSGDIVLTPGKGELVGFVGPKGTLIDSRHIQQHIPSLFGNKTLYERPLSFFGYAIDGYIKDDYFVKKQGFVITDIPQTAGTSTMKVGDIVTFMHTNSYEEKTAAWVLQTAPSTFTARIIRDEEERIMTIKR
tara:strand:+ start:618 stop:1706 length:1089 start_codon:yes stop_codon:yes gene_type:complete